MTESVTEPSRRARKKAATRAAISAAAMRLFLQRGYHAVSVKDIATEADVAVTTLFKHFASKEAMVFDEDDEIEQSLVAAVTERETGQSILDALKGWVLGTRAVQIGAGGSGSEFEQFSRLVDGTPELTGYWRRMWMRHADALAAVLHAAVREGPGALTPTAALALAHFVLDTCVLARGSDTPAVAVEAMFALLREGWPH